MRSSTTRWTPDQAVFAGREALKLLEAHDGALADRLPAGVADQLGRDTAALEASLSARPAFGAESRATTGAERSVAHEAQGLLGRLRALLRHAAPKGDPALRAAGVGMKATPGKSSTVAAGLEAMIAASATHPEAFKAAGIVSTDIDLCRTLHDRLLAAEQSQEQARITRKGLTRDKNATQKRLEDAVIAIALAGELVFRGQPAIVEAFRDLIPRTPHSKKPAIAPTSTPSA